jgi:hypothetical protein
MDYGILLGLKMGSLFTLDSFGEVFPFLGLGTLVTLSGYMIKGIRGAAFALLMGAIIFFYLGGRLPF